MEETRERARAAEAEYVRILRIFTQLILQQPPGGSEEKTA